MHGLVPKAMEWGLQEAEFSWVLESNKLSYGALKKGGAKIIKTYRLYDWEGAEARRAEGARGGDERAGERDAAGTDPRSAPASQPSSLSRLRHLLAPLEIREVHGRRDLNRFLKLPWRIYAEDPHWVPPLLLEVKEFLNPRKHPFYQHGDATQFIAVRGRETLGRILVSDDPLCNRQNGENVGCFGMFECVDDRPTAHALLDAAAGWLRARGRTAIRGPIDYSINYPCGLLIDGFDTPPRVMMNHQPPILRRLAGVVGPAEGLRPLRMVVRRSVEPGVEMEDARRAAGPARQHHHPPFPHRRLRDGSRPLPSRLQRLDAGPVGIRQAHRRRVQLYGQAAEATGAAGTGVAGGSGRPGGRGLHHPARHQRGDPAR